MEGDSSMDQSGASNIIEKPGDSVPKRESEQTIDERSSAVGKITEDCNLPVNREPPTNTAPLANTTSIANPEPPLITKPKPPNEESDKINVLTKTDQLGSETRDTCISQEPVAALDLSAKSVKNVEQDFDITKPKDSLQERTEEGNNERKNVTEQKIQATDGKDPKEEQRLEAAGTSAEPKIVEGDLAQSVVSSDLHVEEKKDVQVPESGESINVNKTIGDINIPTQDMICDSSFSVVTASSLSKVGVVLSSFKQNVYEDDKVAESDSSAKEKEGTVLEYGIDSILDHGKKQDQGKMLSKEESLDEEAKVSETENISEEESKSEESQEGIIEHGGDGTAPPEKQMLEADKEVTTSEDQPDQQEESKVQDEKMDTGDKIAETEKVDEDKKKHGGEESDKDGKDGKEDGEEAVEKSAVESGESSSKAEEKENVEKETEGETKKDGKDDKKEGKKEGEGVSRRSRHGESSTYNFPVENVFEYQWPQESGAEYFFVQEQISEFLGIKSFKRKYPELERRMLDIEERKFLKERGVVTEEQVTLGLNALKSEEVHDMMMRDYPERYAEYAKLIQEKQRQSIKNRHKEYGKASVDATKMQAYIKKAMKQASDYNATLMKERREERQYYLDLQTMLVHHPKTKMKKLSKEHTNPGSYPVAVIPGQFQNYYKTYTPEELKYLPVNTAVYGPMATQRQTDIGPNMSAQDEQSEDEEDFVQKESVEPQPQPHPKRSKESRKTPPVVATIPIPQLPVQLEMKPLDEPPPRVATPQQQTIVENVTEPEKVATPPIPVPQIYKPKVVPNAICGLCLKDRWKNRKGDPEDLVHCSQCDNSGHPSCLEMNGALVQAIKTYPWQCMECKTCTRCGDPTHEDKMMFCDECDRGYHTFCVGLQEIPTGQWSCPRCRNPAQMDLSVPTIPINQAIPTPSNVPMTTPLPGTATPPRSKVTIKRGRSPGRATDDKPPSAKKKRGRKKEVKTEQPEK